MKTKISSVVTALAIAMTLFVSLAIMASADDYTLTCNGEPIELGGTLHSGDVITASVDELWIKLNSESWIYNDSDRQHTFTLPGTNTEYTVTWIDIDIESDEIHLYIVEAVPASADGYTLTCNGAQIEVGDTLHTGDVIESDIVLYINLGGNGWLYEDEDELHTYTLPGDNTEFTVTGIDTSWLPGEIDLIIDVVTNPPSTAEISIDDVDAYIDNQGYGHLRVISQVLFDGKDAEYYGAWFIPADLQIDDNYEKAQVTVSAEIESGDTFASDLRNIPAGSLGRNILVIPFIKLFGEENLATTYGEINVLDNLNETSR